MNFDELKALVSQGESETLEFKKSTATIQAAFETISGFLNGKGGTVLIGVTDGQKIVGQQISDSTKLEIANKIAQIEPPVQLDVEYIPIPNGLQVVMLSVQAGRHKPYTCDGRSFQRTQSRTSKMTQHRYEQLISDGARPDGSWEMRLNQSTIEDLDHDEIRRTVAIAVNVNRLNGEALNDTIKETLTKLELMREGRLTNAAMVLFAKSVSEDFSQCEIKMARFRGKNKLGDFIDNQMVSGNAFYIMQSANEFVMKHLPVASFFNQNAFERIDKPLLPVMAVREALCNAICHRDYSAYNASMTLAIFDDRLEIWNNGTLLPPLTIEDLKKPHQSYPRNKKMARVFYLRKYVETWGAGTIKMLDLCVKSGVPEPVFNEYSGGFAVTFQYKSPIGVTAIEDAVITPNHHARKDRIVSVLIEKPLSAAEIHKVLQIKSSLRSIKRDLFELQKKGVVKQIGNGKNTLWCLNLG